MCRFDIATTGTQVSLGAGGSVEDFDHGAEPDRPAVLLDSHARAFLHDEGLTSETTTQQVSPG